MEHTTHTKRCIDCLLGGALGDALGRPVERIRTPMLYEYYGPNGIQDLATVGLKARITDDTQMTIFTADGLIKSILKNGNTRQPDMKIIYKSYLDWYKTQTEPAPEGENPYGVINKIKELYTPVGPGRTCLETLKNGIPGSIAHPINNSHGSGGVMRVAPVGLVYTDINESFNIGAECAALTHGAPEAYLPSGFHAAVVTCIAGGHNPFDAFERALNILTTYPNHESTSSLIELAIKLAETDTDPKHAIETLGYGFTGNEAMAISVYCILKCPTHLKDALIMAVNHSGDSDSTGAITGNILGAAIGLDTIPKEWLDSLELRDEITQLAIDLAYPDRIKDVQIKYPLI